MADENFAFQAAAGQTLYFVVWNALGTQVLDLNDDTFKALGSATTPHLAATERTDFGGTSYSLYSATLDLSRISSTSTAVPCLLVIQQQAGGSPAPATDSVLSAPLAFTVENGVLRTGGLTTAAAETLLAAFLDAAGSLETSFTLRDVAQIIFAAIAGDIEGTEGGAFQVYDVHHLRTRITGSGDGRANRTITDLDGSL